jgi:hypothetical protein
MDIAFVEIADSDSKKSKGSYFIDNDFNLTGSFDVETVDNEYMGFFIGSRDGESYFTGEILNLELGYLEKSKSFPNCMKSLIMKNQIVD